MKSQTKIGRRVALALWLIPAMPLFIAAGCGGGGGGGDSVAGLTGASSYVVPTPDKFEGTVTINFPAGLTASQKAIIENNFKDAWTVAPLGTAAGGDLPEINAVLNRNLVIKIDVSGASYDCEDIKDWRTVAFHANYLLNVSVAEIASDLWGAILVQMYSMVANMQTKETVRIAKAPVLHATELPKSCSASGVTEHHI
ncbi:MAG: hypothetical protein FWG29_10585 [Treponema sp.]|nr:hypothetical protein [Treponema sp.]